MPRPFASSLAWALSAACLTAAASAHGPSVRTASRSAGVATADCGALRKVTVDAASAVGVLRSLQGVNGAPGPGGHKPEYFTFGGWNMPDSLDASRGYEQAHIDLVRTHAG
jgi:hypothetical protein